MWTAMQCCVVEQLVLLCLQIILSVVTRSRFRLHSPGPGSRVRESSCLNSDLVCHKLAAGKWQMPLSLNMRPIMFLRGKQALLCELETQYKASLIGQTLALGSV
jgi:hypothetical protein